MVTTMRFTTIELQNLKFMAGRVPFDYLCYLLYHSTPTEIRETLMACGLVSADTLNKTLEDIDSLAQAYKSNRKGLLQSNLWHTSYELLSAIKDKVTLTAEDKAYLDNPVSPVAALEYDTSKAVLKYEHTDDVLDLYLQADFDIQLHWLIGGYSTASFVLTIELLHKAIEKYAPEKQLTFAWQNGGYYKPFTCVPVIEYADSMPLLTSDKKADTLWETYFNDGTELDEETANSDENSEIAEDKGTEEKPVLVESEQNESNTAENSETSEVLKELLVSEQSESAEIEQNESNTAENFEIGEGVPEIHPVEPTDSSLYAPMRIWSAEELTTLVEYMSFMRITDLSRLLCWSEAEIVYKIGCLKHRGITTVEQLKEHL